MTIRQMLEPHISKLDAQLADRVCGSAWPPLHVPNAVRQLIDAGAAVLVSISGGKDSQAMLLAVCELARREGWLDRVTAGHADLGRAEWPETPAAVEAHAAAAGVPLRVVRRAAGDLVERMERRKDQLAGSAPFWPSPAARYCTSDLKRGPLDILLRELRREAGAVVSVEGIRAEESTARAKKLPCQTRAKVQTKSQDALTWRPLLGWTEAHVWARIGTTLEDLDRRRALYQGGDEEQALDGWPAHPAYVYGNERVSCQLCILASEGDLRRGVKHGPDLARLYAGWEQETGFTFCPGLSIQELLDKG